MSEKLVEGLKQQGLDLLRTNEPEQAIEIFDEAIAASTDPILTERLQIHKSMGRVALEQFDAPELKELPKIVLRRRDDTNVYLAAYALAFRFRIEQKLDRAAHYGKIANETARSLGRQEWVLDSLTELGNIAVYDSRFADAIRCYGDALDLLSSDADFRWCFLYQNLGYARLANGSVEEGIELIGQALEAMESTGYTGFIAESHLDLALGYLELEQYDLARQHGRLGLETATENRQIRNGHYLLGEIAHYSGDPETAEIHFEHLCRFYPDFPQLKNLLYAIDLRGVINWKL
ncbi:MAG: hypothetical protein R3338_12585 [Thermoanaerobaculia bacterium]|nr:hypothetical protein [Thermoanaerobaculia bacterium]